LEDEKKGKKDLFPLQEQGRKRSSLPFSRRKQNQGSYLLEKRKEGGALSSSASVQKGGEDFIIPFNARERAPEDFPNRKEDRRKNGKDKMRVPLPGITEGKRRGEAAHSFFTHSAKV